MSQSRAMSAVESATNIGVGYGLAIVTQIVVFPLFGLHASAAGHFGIAGIFTAISLARSYALRRLFNGGWKWVGWRRRHG